MLFVHVITSMIALFQYITSYNVDFQITLGKPTNSKESLLFDFKLTAFLHKIKDTYCISIYYFVN